MENNWQPGSSTLTKAWGPKYGGDCLRWESAISFLKLSEHKALAENCHHGPGRVFMFSVCGEVLFFLAWLTIAVKS